MSFGTAEVGSWAHRQAFATPTAHSLESGNAASDIAADLWAMPRNVVFTHTGGIQMAEKQPTVGETGLNGMMMEQPGHQIDIKTVHADPAAIGPQNYSPTSQNQRANHEERGNFEHDFGNHQFGTHRSATEIAQINGAVVGPSHATSQQLPPSPANLRHMEENYRSTVPYGHTGHPLKQHYSAGDLYVKQTQRIFNGEPPPQYERPGNEIQHLFQCGVCMDEQPVDYVTFLDPCRHKFCRNCIKNHIDSQLSERRFPILCPVCKAVRSTTNPGSAYAIFLR